MHSCMNDLPRVAAQQCGDQELNLRLVATLALLFILLPTLTRFMKLFNLVYFLITSPVWAPGLTHSISWPDVVQGD